MIIALCPNPSVDKILSLTHFHLGQVNRCISERSFPGGKGVHVALALKELGSETKLIGFWGGPTGTWIRNECAKKNISCFGPTVSQWTRTCITMLTEDESNNTEILEKGPKIIRDQLNQFFETVTKEINSAKAICVSGSWPADTPDNVYEKLQTICKQQNIDLWIDASGERLKQALEVKPFGIHINKKEASDYYGKDFTPVEFTKKLLAESEVVALTDGENGLFLGYKNSIIHGKFQLKNIISTVGAGDCLTAGLLYSWYQKESIEDIARTATASGAANCVCPDLGMLCKKDVAAIKNNVHIKLYDVS